MGYSEYDKKVLPILFLSIVALAVVLAILFRRKSERIRSIPTAIIAIALLFIEIVKQRWNFLGDFDLYCLPFHYCSLFLLIIPLAELCGVKLSRIFRPIATCMAFTVSASMYVFPNGIIGNACEVFGESFYRTHTLIFHHLIVLYFVLSVLLRLYKPRWHDALGVGIAGALYVVVAIPIAYKFNVNYCNILESIIPVMEKFRIEYGQVAYTVMLSVCLTFGTALASLLYIGSHKLISLCFKGKKG